MYLGIDVGTSEVKAVLVDGDDRPIATGRGPLSVERPHPRWSEQDPDSWWRAAETAIAEIRAHHAAPLAATRGIGLSGQMHGAVLLDESDQILRPAILWNDARSSDECEELERRAPDSRRITGNLAMPGFTAPKLLWVARHEPAIFQRTAKVLLPKDHVRWHLTGEHVSEMSDAAGTLWLDVEKRTWSDAMLDATGLQRRHMPRLVEGSQPSGRLRPELASAWGMTGDIAVAGGGGDNAASAVGLGAVTAGRGFLSLGTSGVLFVVRSGYQPNPERGVHTFCHALPGLWHHMAVTLSAASCLRWVTHLTGARDEAALLGEVSALGPDAAARAPIFLPYLSGERTPHNDAYARGVWFGLDHDTDRAALGYSVIEGVAFGLADGYAALLEAGGPATSVSLAGGGSRSRLWARLLASVLDLPLSLTEGAEVGAALGAARLGHLAAEPQADIASVCRPPAVADTIEPAANWRELLLTRFRRFRALYPPLRPHFREATP